MGASQLLVLLHGDHDQLSVTSLLVMHVASQNVGAWGWNIFSRRATW